MSTMNGKKQDGNTYIQRKGMEVIYDTGIQNIDGYTGGFVLLERLPSYDG
jgi:hypothetical protein